MHVSVWMHVWRSVFYVWATGVARAFKKWSDQEVGVVIICPFMFKSGRTFQMVGRTYQVKRRQIKKEGKKRWGEK